LVYIRKKKIKGRDYYYAVHSTRVGNKVKKIERYLGINKPKKSDIIKLSKEYNSIKAFLDNNNESINKIKEEYQEFLETASSDELNKNEENIITLFTYDSNRIEGSKLTLKDTKTLLIDGITPREKPLRDIKEAENHKNAYLFIKEYNKDIDKSFIKELHKMLKENVSEDAGTFRDRQVVVGDLVPVKADMIKSEINNLIKWNRNNKDLHLIERVSIFHCIFERIHPFFDGNGRVGRLLMNYMFLRDGFPIVLIRNKNRRRYYNALRRADEGNYLFMIKYIYSELEKSCLWR